MDKEIIEGNKLIAEFVEFKKTNNGNYWVPNLWPSKEYTGETTFGIEQIPFHTSWDWLMPVVEKIESIHDDHHGYFGVHISSNGCAIQATNFRSDKPIANPPHYFADYTLDTKIKAVWIAVVFFIKWYNQNK